MKITVLMVLTLIFQSFSFSAEIDDNCSQKREASDIPSSLVLLYDLYPHKILEARKQTADAILRTAWLRVIGDENGEEMYVKCHIGVDSEQADLLYREFVREGIAHGIFELAPMPLLALSADLFHDLD